MQLETEERLWRHWPGSTAPGYARAFGDRADDLDLDFAALARPDLVSALLHRCLRTSQGGCSSEDAWSWTLPQRLQALLAITQASGISSITFLQPCSNCSEALELNVALDMFEREEAVRDFEWSPIPERCVRVALPTGYEQREWSRRSRLDRDAMARALIREVDGAAPATDWHLPDDWIDGLAAELEQRDPLTALDLETVCPACGAHTSIAVDLEAELLARLHARQRQTLNDVHRLASAYHWSEPHILGLPVWRRRYYLAQLGPAGRA